MTKSNHLLLQPRDLTSHELLLLQFRFHAFITMQYRIAVARESIASTIAEMKNWVIRAGMANESTSITTKTIDATSKGLLSIFSRAIENTTTARGRIKKNKIVLLIFVPIL